MFYIPHSDSTWDEQGFLLLFFILPDNYGKYVLVRYTTIKNLDLDIKQVNMTKCNFKHITYQIICKNARNVSHSRCVSARTTFLYENSIEKYDHGTFRKLLQLYVMRNIYKNSWGCGSVVERSLCM